MRCWRCQKNLTMINCITFYDDDIIDGFGTERVVCPKCAPELFDTLRVSICPNCGHYTTERNSLGASICSFNCLKIAISRFNLKKYEGRSK